MVSKKILWVFFIVLMLVLLFSSFVSADGCCVDDDLGACLSVLSEDKCQTGNVEYLDNTPCASAPECERGCCCPTGTTGVGRINHSCTTGTFLVDSSVTIGGSCSCVATEFQIKGKITKTPDSGALSGATVSAVGLGVTNTSMTNGNYVLNDVPGGTNVVIAATNESCISNSITIANLNSDRTGQDIELNCVCSNANQDCDYASNRYCMVGDIWSQAFTLSNPSQKATYCGRCPNDPDCEGVSNCEDDDGDCPPGCTAANDNDCECDADTPNGVCPDHCSISGPNEDADCNLYNPVCGDHLVTYPYETCEQEPADGQPVFCEPDDCAEEGEAGECNCLSLSGCGNGIFEPNLGEQCEIGMMCADGSTCEACSCGPVECIGNVKKPTLRKPDFDYNDGEMELGWSLLSSCMPSVISYSVFKCNKTASDECGDVSEFYHLGNSIPSKLNYSDMDIIQSAEYCYYVEAYYDGSATVSSIQCQKTGNYYCMEEHPDEFCMNNIRSYCDSSNNIKEISGGNCNPDKYCMGPDRDGKTSCMEVGVCDACNGLFGMFSNLDLSVWINEVDDQGNGYLAEKFCHVGSGPLLTGCYLDRTKTLFSSFDYCADISNCYDYKSKAACEDSSDPCDKNSICEWAPVDASHPDLEGICRPDQNNKELHRCEFCDNDEYNWLSPGCTPQVCSLFGDCHFQGNSQTRINAPTCSQTSIANCRDYGSQTECTGGTAAIVTATYDNNNRRTAGTHQLTPSNDELGLGKCFWMTFASGRGECHRDADGLRSNYNTNLGFECNITDFYCEADFSNPTTTILPSALGVYPARPTIRYSTQDNYPSDRLKTRFCISRDNCYPTERGDGSTGEFTPLYRFNTSGTYNLRYYTEDPANNLEVVTTTQIKIDAERPFINLTDPSDPENFPTNQQVVPVVGITATDSKFVCAENTITQETRCVNNCALTSGRQPCFSDNTGVFNLDILLGDDNFTDIVFSAEDFAGNTYQNTLLGVLLDVEPPDEPIITISPKV